MDQLNIATFNINGIRARLPNLLEWLAREQPDVVCLQELKAQECRLSPRRHPRRRLRRDLARAEVLERRGDPGARLRAAGIRRGLPGDPDDSHSRYLEAAVHGVIVACLYLPNGNPQPGPKFDYKLAWFERLIEHAAGLLASGHPVVLAGDYNVVPTDADIYNPRSWRKDALLQPESRDCYARLLAQGWTDALRARYPDEPVFTFWDYFRQHWQKNSGLRIDHLLLSPDLAPRLRDAGVHRWVRGQEHASDHAPAWVLLDASGRSG